MCVRQIMFDINSGTNKYLENVDKKDIYGK